MKLFFQINSFDNCLKLQADLNNFFKWFQTLGLTLNFNKCHITSFTKKHFVIILINNAEISRVETIVGLGMF